MPEAAEALFELSTPTVPSVNLADDAELAAGAAAFCANLPYRQPPYSKRNWGGVLHSLCSYQGKLKPSIAHFLIQQFTTPGEVVVDPMAGVGTIPLEARRQERVAVAGDLSELAAAVCLAKLGAFEAGDVTEVFTELGTWLSGAPASLDELIESENATFGLNGPIVDYFEPRTLREVLLARQFFAPRIRRLTVAEAVVLTSLLHILHGNRPYALSRRSHPVTPFKPSGPAEYRPLLPRLATRVERVLPELSALPQPGRVNLADYRDTDAFETNLADAVITSPPFARSLRFFSSNWMRLWFCGWRPADFKARPPEFLEREQGADFDAAYGAFLEAMARIIRPRGRLILHLGVTAHLDMADRISRLLGDSFYLVHSGSESVADGESHGLTDKGTTTEHAFLFCRRR